ncbi:MAG: hypothetical protein DMG64_12040 [Acidobacteria bacterium]|nr:MAG: hypothetical protein DMG64_12040 [Acidobacteriota bacterium]
MQVSFGAIQRFCLFVGTIVLLNLSGCAGSHRTDIARTLRSEFSAPEGSPQIIAAYQPWFGRSGHIDVGYNSQDSNVLAQRVSSEHGFKTAIMYDESVDDPSCATQQAISDLQYAYEHYIGPKSSMPAGAYLSYDGRPMIFVFPKSGDTDWKRVKQAVDGWEHPPILLYEDQDAKDWGAFDGYYAWVSPGKKGWVKDGSNWGRSYLEDFYSRMSKQTEKIAVGAAWPGFDDSKAEWGQGRKMDARCGKTLEDSLNLHRRYFPADRPLPFLMIVTWNDYEEGTAIERGIADCGGKTETAQRAGG